MSSIQEIFLQQVQWFYKSLLGLLPHRFYAEFGDEIWEVFLARHLEAQARGMRTLLKSSLRETAALLISVCREHWHAGKQHRASAAWYINKRWVMLRNFGMNRRVLFTWVIANIIGFAVLVGLMGLASLLPVSLRDQSFAVTAFTITVPLGLAQWAALRQFSQTSILWLATIPLGLLLSIFILNAIPERMWVLDDESVTVLTIGYLFTGFVIGLFQWFILRRQFQHSATWLLGSTAGLGFAFWLILVTDLVHQSGPLAFILGSLSYILITGLVLSRLVVSPEAPQVV